MTWAAAAVSADTLASPEIEYASPDQSVWTTRLTDRGEPDNPLLRYADALFARVGLRWHGKTYPAARLFKNLQDGQAHFSILVRAPALKACCLFSRKPVAVAEIRAYVVGGKAAPRSRAELHGQSVITVYGYSYGDLRAFLDDSRNGITRLTAHTHESAFAMLAQRRAEVLIDYSGPATEVLTARPIADVSFEVLERQPVFLVLSRSYPDAERLMARLEQAADALEAAKSAPATK